MLGVQTGLWKCRCMPELFIFSSFLLSFLFSFTSYRGLRRILNALPQIHRGHFLLASYKWDFWFCCRDLDVQLVFICFIVDATILSCCCFISFAWQINHNISNEWKVRIGSFCICLICVCMCSHDQQAGWHCHPGLVYRADVCHCFTDPGAPHRLLHKEEQRRQISR